MTMANGVNLTPLQISQLPDDPTKPMYSFDCEQWDEAPKVFIMELDETLNNPTRTSKNNKYKENGNALMWNRYVAFGYYHTHNVYDFIEKWEQTEYSVFDLCKMVWREYSCYLTRQASPTNPQLMVWTLNIALPFLFNHDPDYHLASILDIEEATNTKLPSYITNPNTWLQIGKKNKKSPPSSPQKYIPPPSNQAANKTTPFTLQALGKIVRRPRTNPSSPIKRLLSRTNPPLLADSESDSNSSILITPNPTEPAPTALSTSPKNLSSHSSKSTNFEPLNPNNQVIQPTVKSPQVNENVTNQSTHTSATQVPKATNPSRFTSNTDSPISNPYAQPSPRVINTQSQKSKNTDINDTASSTNQSTLNTKFVPFVAVNDGTYRLTIRWKPLDYRDLRFDHIAWNRRAHAAISTLFGSYNDKIGIVKWAATKENTICCLADINEQEGQIREFLSPRITQLDSSEQFVFGLRITLRNQSPASWISDPQTRASMASENLNVNISNSKCDSGEIVVAGHLLLKHPDYTHRHFYLMALRRQLPPSTPFFDIGTMTKAPNGENILHMVVRCGANHADVLMDILSAHLDGDNNTTLFVGHKQMSSMTTEEVSEFFRVHQNFLNSTQRLPLSPNVVNVDRPREEVSASGQRTTRSAREWVMTLKTETGKPLQCDVANGGKDRKAYMIVTTAHLDKAKFELEKYKASLRRSYASDNYHGDAADTTRPIEIYIPTAAVMKNVNFMKRMSAANIWKEVPETVRQHSVSTQPPVNKTKLSIQVGQTTENLESEAIGPEDTSTVGGPPSVASSRNTGNPRRPSLDITAGTTNSPLTRATTHGNNTLASNISDLEASFEQQKAEFHQIKDRMTFMDESAQRANEAYRKMSSLQIQLDQMFLVIQKICEKLDDNRITPKRNTRKKKKTNTSSSSDTSMKSTRTTTSEYSNVTSPEKKKRRAKPILMKTDHNDEHTEEASTPQNSPRNTNISPTIDQMCAQYSPNCAADEASPD
jgi:hypothetical protein